jgi:hypothetical protein
MAIGFNPLPSFSNLNKQVKNSMGIYGNGKSGYANSMTSTISERLKESQRSERELKNQKLRNLIRGLTTEPLKNNNNTHSATLSNKVNGYLDLNSTNEKKAKEALKSYKYNYKDVSTRIQRAKTSVSAGQAVIAAKRKVIEIKRKLSVKSEDSGELQAALIHAERMEMVARKKKHHLELEELVSNTMKRDESLEKFEDASTNKASDKEQRIDSLPSPVEEKITEAEDMIFDERYKMIEDMMDVLQEEDISNLSDEMLDEMNEMIASFGEDELEMLEEAMDMAELMEVVDPHMSKEDYENLKRKHRASEERAIMKADMDYLKAVIKMNMDKSLKSPSLDAGAGMSGFSGNAFSASSMPDVSVSAAPAPDMSVDVAI